MNIAGPDDGTNVTQSRNKATKNVATPQSNALRLLRRTPPRGLPPAPTGALERGVALVIALILLVVITLMGFAAVRGTIMQQRMATNVYDRQVAFQSAEAALRVAAMRIQANPADIARNCQAGGIVCLGNPFDDKDLPAGSIHDVPAGSSSTEYAAGSIASGQPQYVVENMGNWYDASSGTGFNQTANSHNLGTNGGSQSAIYYRVTARSGDPTKVGSRAVVTLQAMIKSG